MKRENKQPRRASKSGVAADRLQPSSDVSPQATRGGDKESNEPLPRMLKSKGAQTSPGRKPSR